MDDVEVPHRVFEHLLTGFVCHEGEYLAQNYADGGLAHPGDPFGTVFAWLWEAERSVAVSLFADLLAEARRHAPKGKEVPLDNLLKDLRFALHNTQLSHVDVYQEVEKVLREKVPEYFGGNTSL